MTIADSNATGYERNKPLKIFHAQILDCFRGDKTKVYFSQRIGTGGIPLWVCPAEPYLPRF
jgi:hypothetical protein